MKPPRGAAARVAAADAIIALEEGRATRVAEALDISQIEDRRDAGLARELAVGAVRYQRLYDAMCKPHLRGDQRPPPLLAALRIGAHQLFALDRIPVHAAISTGVGALGGRSAGLRGVVNAVLRRLSEIRLDERGLQPGPLGRIPEALWPIGLGERHSLPDALIRDLQDIAPGDEDAAFGALNLVPPLCTRLRPGAEIDHPAVIRRDGNFLWWRDPAAAIATAVRPGHAVVQDRAQASLLELADAKPGQLVLDCCAAPGGKSRYLSDLGCKVVAADLVPSKLGRLVQGLGERPRVACHDARRPCFMPGFDLVVVDAPCSNSGVVARRPEARWRYGAAGLSDLERLQTAILVAASRLVSRSGRLLYTTCSLSPRENTDRIAALPGWRVVSERLVWPDGWNGGGYGALLERTTS